MASLNRVTMIGNLGRDAELRSTRSGATVASFSIAVTDKWKDREGAQQEKTIWVRCSLWGKAAEALAPYLVKGKSILIEGALEIDEWEDKDGQKRTTPQIKVRDLTLLGGGKRQDGDDQRRSDTEDSDSGAQSYPADDDAIPF